MATIGQAYGQKIVLKDKLRLTMSKVRVTQVIDGQTMVVNNETTLHIPMLYIPQDNAAKPDEAMVAAKNYLEETLKDRFIRVYQVRDQKRGQVNALGHVEAYIEREDGLWVQHDMVEKGLAFVYPTQSHYDFVEELYKAEAKARAEKAGLWENPKWAVVSDEEAKTLSNRYAIVEGQIERIATRNNTIYLNFERDWKTDFTIAIDSLRRRDFARAGSSPMQWGGEHVRVRGWLQDYNGPYIEIYHPSQIEILEKPSSPDDRTVKAEPLTP